MLPSVVVAGGSAGEAVGVAGRDVELVEACGVIAERGEGVVGFGELVEDVQDGVSPGVGAEALGEGLDGLLGRLLGGEAGPLVEAGAG